MPTRPPVVVWFAGGLLLAIVLRLCAAVAVEQIVSATPGRLCLIEGDAEGYWLLAGTIAEGRDYSIYDPPRRILRMPGLPVVLAACRLVFDDNLLATRCVLAVLSAAVTIAVFLLGRMLAGPAVAVVATLAVAVSPPLVVFSPLLLTEGLFATAMAFSLVPLVWLLRGSTAVGTSRKGMTAAAAATGILIALATYVRPTWLPVAGLAAISLIGIAPRSWWRWQQSLALVAGCVVTLAPWVARNADVSGHLVVTTLWVGPSLYDGLHPGATGDSDMAFFDQENLLATCSEWEMDQEYRRRAWAFVAEQPLTTARLAVVKAMRTLSPWPNSPQFRAWWIRGVLGSVTWTLYGLAAVGLWHRRQDWLFLAVTVGPMLGLTAVHMLFVGSIRYRLPADALLWIAAAEGALQLLPRTWQRWLPTTESTGVPEAPSQEARA